MKRLAILTLAAGLLAACTPQEAIRLTFGNPDAGGSPALEAQAQHVAHCETGGTFNVRAVSPTNDHGLFQINRRYHQAAFTQLTGRPWVDVYHPFWNAVYAHHLYRAQGWGPWTCQP